ncbi:hypothetical protein [Sphaerotilus uruguayifluvii]|uniref:Uncharacterized protein n=1 Tax=Sphaerotilus uruguayifluvii TaxID=2735897 RepID=A0ABX2FYY7_9BURK|nr:hypothetical protein [Leptothrix sp. C29]NRT55231.1 hypothetical protein [Leptothrix sp. C29]
MTTSATRTLSLALIAVACALSAVPASAVTKKKAAAAAEAAPAPAVLADLSPEQIDSAGRVLVGAQQCEFGQKVDLSPADKPGYFHLNFNKRQYTMAPEPTTTGAVRLEDKHTGVVWIQIANKSMLMNAKAGQRMVDECVHPDQKKPQQSAEAGAPASR